MLENPHPLTINSFNDFAEIVTAKGKQLIIVQYPLMSIEPLKNAVKLRTNVTFVENKVNFEQAIAKSGREEYFVDLLTPLFGHGTEEGNRLIAKNLAETITSLITARNQ